MTLFVLCQVAQRVGRRRGITQRAGKKQKQPDRVYLEYPTNPVKAKEGMGGPFMRTLADIVTYWWHHLFGMQLTENLELVTLSVSA